MKLIRKLIVGISTICLLVMTFVSATYAWFEINSRASVENFHFEVHGGQGFLVSIDNVNYYNDLNLLQLQKAMLVAYGDGEYRLANDGSEKLYHVSYEEVFENGSIVQKEVTTEMSEQNINDVINGEAEGINGIRLYPTTTKNGRDLTDMYESTSNVSSGKYLQFSVYFRTQSRRKEDNFAYEIYLNGSDGQADDGSIIEPTKITSSKTEVPLSANMDAVVNADDGKYVTSLKRSNTQGARDKIYVYSSNAVRFSITNQEYYEEYQKDANGNVELDENGNKKIASSGYKLAGDNPPKIYELNDTVNTNTDLGSYATDYNGGYTESELNAMIDSGNIIDNNLALYCSRFNAMFTYYNNLKPDAQITHLSYDNMPKTIRDLSNKDIITTVVAGEEAKLLTFRLWLEGWDADCFDGIKYAVKVKLAFGSKRVDLA